MTRNPAFLRGLFTTYVRTHIEYCVNLWNPVHRTDIEKLEKVQNMFTRLLRFSSVMTPHERNECIGITSHEIRRNRGDLIAMYQNMYQKMYQNNRQRQILHIQGKPKHQNRTFKENRDKASQHQFEETLLLNERGSNRFHNGTHSLRKWSRRRTSTYSSHDSTDISAYEPT